MIAAWMIFAIVTGALFALAALAAARAASAMGRQTRAIWCGALVAAAFWPPVAIAASHFRGAGEGSGILALPITVVDWQAHSLAGEAWPGRLGASLEVALVAMWILLSFALVARLVRALRALHRERDSWRHESIDGVRVRLSSDVGPAVVGLGVMEIVLPEWVLSLDSALLAMVLRHEDEHRRARDPWLLVGAALLVALVPWNPVLWWCARRLRLAVELDCDTRVLDGQPRPERYGLLLIMMAQRAGTRSTGLAPALTNPSSNLERRIVAMRRAIPRFARTQLLVFSALAAATVAVACSVDSPEGVTASRSAAAPHLDSDSTAYLEYQVEQPVIAANGNRVPVYPASLEKAHVSGQVLVQFVVNTDGSADMASFKVLKSSHALFTQSVKDALSSMRFVPAEVGGKKVRQLVQMPFGFKVPEK
jgi:TonB family protein